MERTVTTPLAEKADDRRALFLDRAGAGLGGAAVSGRLAVVGLGPGAAGAADRRGGGGDRGGDRISSAMRPTSARLALRAGAGGACLGQPRGAGAGAGGAGAGGGGAAGRGGVGGRSRGLRHGGGGLRGGRGGAGGLAAARDRGAAGGHGDAGGGGALRGAARARFLRDLAVGQPQALGGGRGAAAGGGGGGVRARALQPGEPGAAVAARAGVRGAARGAAAGDGGGLRPRGGAGGRADRGACRWPRREPGWRTWRPA